MLSEFVVPIYYDGFVDAVIELRQENKQLAITLGYYVRKLAVLKRGEGIRRRDSVMRTEGQDFLDLYSSSWGETVMPSTLRMQQKEKLNKPILLPSGNDIQKLAKFIDTEIERELELSAGKNNHAKLQKLLLSALLIFNKRRPQEVASLTVGDFRAGQATRDDRSDILTHLPIEEQTISER